MNLLDAVHAVVERIPPDEVWTYTDVAATLGFRAARHTKDVRTAVAKLVRDQTRVGPWWRVVANNGKLIVGAEREQQALLVAEGVTFDAQGNVNLAQHGRR